MCAQSVTAGSGLSASCSMCAISSHGGLVRDVATYIQKKNGCKCGPHVCAF